MLPVVVVLVKEQLKRRNSDKDYVYLPWWVIILDLLYADGHTQLRLKRNPHSTKSILENPGIDPGTSHMLSERSTTWANSPS